VIKQPAIGSRSDPNREYLNAAQKLALLSAGTPKTVVLDVAKEVLSAVCQVLASDISAEQKITWLIEIEEFFARELGRWGTNIGEIPRGKVLLDQIAMFRRRTSEVITGAKEG